MLPKIQSLEMNLNDNQMSRIQTIARLRFIAFYFDFIGNPIETLNYDSISWDKFIMDDILYNHACDCLADYIMDSIRKDPDNISTISDYLFIIFSSEFVLEHDFNKDKVKNMDLELDFILTDVIPNNDHRLFIYCIFNKIVNSFNDPYILVQYRKILINRTEMYTKDLQNDKQYIEYMMDLFMYSLIDEISANRVLWMSRSVGSISVYDGEEEEDDGDTEENE